MKNELLNKHKEIKETLKNNSAIYIFSLAHGNIIASILYFPAYFH